MSGGRLTRRQVVVGGIVGMASLIAPRGAAEAGATATAAAAGTLTLGGDLVVNRMGFGSPQITGPGIWGEPKEPAEAHRVLRRAVELGVNFIDTADAYGPEVSERLIAEALHPYPQGLVIATKGGLVRPGPSQWVPDGDPSTCARRAKRVSSVSSSHVSISTSSTASIRRCRWRIRSGSWHGCRRKARSATWACRISTSRSSHARAA